MSSLWQWLQGQRKSAENPGVREEWGEICNAEIRAGKVVKKQKYLTLAICYPEAWEHKVAEKRKCVESEHEEMEEGEWMLRTELHERVGKDKAEANIAKGKYSEDEDSDGDSIFHYKKKKDRRTKRRKDSAVISKKSNDLSDEKVAALEEGMDKVWRNKKFRQGKSGLELEDADHAHGGGSRRGRGHGRGRGRGARSASGASHEDDPEGDAPSDMVKKETKEATTKGRSCITQLSQQRDKCAEIWEKMKKAKTPGAREIASKLKEATATLEASKATVTKKLAEPVITPDDMKSLTFKCCKDINNAKKYLSMAKPHIKDD